MTSDLRERSVNEHLNQGTISPIELYAHIWNFFCLTKDGADIACLAYYPGSIQYICPRTVYNNLTNQGLPTSIYLIAS